MTVRELQPADISVLANLAEIGGFPYPERSDLEAVQIVVDDSDQIVMACGAKRLVELYLWMNPKSSTVQRMTGIRLLHKTMAAVLRGKGYNSVEAFLPPSIAAKFGRRLERSFQWVRNWPSWTKEL